MILVTGSTGFLGQRVFRRLVDRAEDVRLLVRDASRLDIPDGATPDVMEGDVTDEASLRRAVEGCDRVVHAAALVREWVRDPTEFDRVNVEAPGRLLDAASDAGVGKDEGDEFEGEDEVSPMPWLGPEDAALAELDDMDTVRDEDIPAPGLAIVPLPDDPPSAVATAEGMAKRLEVLERLRASAQEARQPQAFFALNREIRQLERGFATKVDAQDGRPTLSSGAPCKPARTHSWRRSARPATPPGSGPRPCAWRGFGPSGGKKRPPRRRR